MADIRVWIDNVPYFDAWASVSGGNLEAEESKTRPGGMGREVSAGGPASRGDMTLQIQMSEVIAAAHPRIESLVGPGRVRVGINWLGTNRVPLGTGTTRQGTLKAATLPDMESRGAAVGMYEIVVSCDEQAG